MLAVLNLIKNLLSKNSTVKKTIEVGDILNYGIATRMDMYVQVVKKTSSFCEVRPLDTNFTPYKWDMVHRQEGTVLPKKDGFSSDTIERRKILLSKDGEEYIRMCKGFGGIAHLWNGRPGQRLND